MYLAPINSRSGTIRRYGPVGRKCGLVGRGWLTQAFNPDLKTGRHTFNPDHTICRKCVTSPSVTDSPLTAACKM